MSEYRPDIAFGPVPLWLLRMEVSDRAVRLYALLSAERDYGTDMATLGRKRLSGTMRCSLDSLDRAKRELETVGAIMVGRGSDNGTLITNSYMIVRSLPGSRTGAATPLAARVRPDSRTGAVASLQSESSSTSTRGRAPQTVDGKRVTSAEHDLCDAILASFNEVSGKRFAGKEWRRAIVGRIREHPEVLADEHLGIIRFQFEHPWWKDDPSPAVIYGNGATFDRALNGVRGVGNNVPDGVEGDDPWAEGAFHAGA